MFRSSAPSYGQHRSTLGEPPIAQGTGPPAGRRLSARGYLWTFLGPRALAGDKEVTVTNLQVPGEESPSTAERYSMEYVVTYLARLRAAIQRALDERFGPRYWQPDPSVPQFSRRDADVDTPHAQTVSLGRVYFAGHYPASLWRAAADTVAETGEDFGFTHLVVRQDSPEGMCVTGQHRRRHVYDFGIGATTVLSVRSGPAVWAGVPYTNAAQVRPD